MNRLLRDKKAIAVFTVPTLFFFIVLELVPIMISLGYTFYEGQPGVNFKFVGLNNYIRLLGDSRLRTVVGNNLVFTLGITAGQIILGFITACILNSVVTAGKNVVRTLLFIPVILPSVAAAQLWSKIYALTPNYGVLNALLKLVGLESLVHAWTGEVGTAMGALIAVGIWKSFGMYVLLFYSGLIDISQEMLEAASIDGANTLQTVWHVEIPLLKPVLRMSLIMILTACFKEYDMTVALTNGGPGSTTLMPSMYMYSMSFTNFNFGYGSAIAIVILLECLIVTGIVNLALSKDNTAEGKRR